MTQVVLTLLAFASIIYAADAAAPIVWTEPIVSGTDGDGAISISLAEDAAATATSIAIQADAASEYAILSQPTTGLFTIDATSGVLTLTANLDFETSQTYLLTITAGDGAAMNSGTVTATLSITDVNEEPTFSPSTYNPSASHGDAAGTSITTVTATDVDSGDSITYAIESGDTNNDFQIDSSTGEITVATGQTLDQGTTPTYVLMVTAVDSGSLTATATVSITVAAAGGASIAWTEPNIGSTDGTGTISSTLPENTAAGTTSITIAATGASVYTITAQSSSGLFTIANDGVLSLATATLDFETTSTYLLTIEGGDGAGNTGTITATLSISNVNEVPTFSTTTYSATVNDGATATTSVTTVTATDVDAGDSITFAIVPAGNTNTDFQIDASTGVITVASGQTLDQATTPTYVLEVTAVDTDGPLTATATVSITVAAGGAAPTAWTEPTIGSTNGDGPISSQLPENTAVGSTGITIVATGATAYDIMAQPSSGLFTIANDGVLSLATATLDFETTPTYLLTIRGGDGAGNSGTITATLSISGVNEAPVFSATSYDVQVADMATEDTTVTTLNATDEDGDTIAFAITGGNENGDFQVGQSTGTISVASTRTLDKSTTSSYALTVTATDPSSLAGTSTVSITFSSSVKCSYSWLGVLLATMFAIYGN